MLIEKNPYSNSILEFIELDEARQSSTSTEATCGCDASKAIDGDFNTFSKTQNNETKEWWKAAMVQRALVDTVIIYTPDGSCSHIL